MKKITHLLFLVLLLAAGNMAVSCSSDDDKKAYHTSWTVEYDNLVDVPVGSTVTLSMNVREELPDGKVNEFTYPVVKTEIPSLNGGFLSNRLNKKDIVYKAFISAPEIAVWDGRTDTLEIRYDSDFNVKAVYYNGEEMTNMASGSNPRKVEIRVTE